MFVLQIQKQFFCQYKLLKSKYKMYRAFMPSEPKKKKEKLSDATLNSGRNSFGINIDIDATIDVLVKALTLFVYRSPGETTFRQSVSSQSGLEIVEDLEGKLIHELRDHHHSEEQGAVWETIVNLHRTLLDELSSNNASDESSVTKILEHCIHEDKINNLGEYTFELNKRIVSKLVCQYLSPTYGWTMHEAALFVLCVKDAATMDEKFDFWSVNARPFSMQVMKTKDGHEIAIW